MSHVDEGLIHAYIDGAFPPGNEQGDEIERHLEVCVDCSVRLEKARELNERAQVVMHRLAPADIVRPAFEEILARRERAATAASVTPVESPPAGGRRPSVPAMPLAWAASLILALGAGWMAREHLWAPRFADGAAELAAPVSSDADARSTRQRAEQSAVKAAEAPLAPPASAAGELPDPVRDETAARAAGASDVAALPSSQKSVVGLEAGRSAQPAEVLPPPAEARAQARLPLGRRLSDPGAAARAALVSALPSDSLDVDLTDTTQIAAAILRDYVVATRAQAWTPVPAHEVPGRIGYERPAQIEGLEAAGVEESGPDASPLRRTVYRLEDGTTVELLQRLEPVEIQLNEIVVTGVQPVSRDTAGQPTRPDSTPGRQLQAAPFVAQASVPAVQTLTVTNDATHALAGASIVAVSGTEG
ncbi:MAG: hypothetical protein ACRELX_12520, partial [Longimicrobiales bacterium]